MLLNLIHRIRQHLADLPTFQALAGGLAASEAIERVLVFGDARPTTGWTAYIVFYPTTDFALPARISPGLGVNAFSYSQSAIFVIVIKTDDHAAESAVAAINAAGAIVEEFLGMPPANGLNITGFEQIRPPNIGPDDNPVAILLDDQPGYQFAFQVHSAR